MIACLAGCVVVAAITLISWVSVSDSCSPTDEEPTGRSLGSKKKGLANNGQLLLNNMYVMAVSKNQRQEIHLLPTKDEYKISANEFKGKRLRRSKSFTFQVSGPNVVFEGKFETTACECTKPTAVKEYGRAALKFDCRENSQFKVLYQQKGFPDTAKSIVWTG